MGNRFLHLYQRMRLRPKLRLSIAHHIALGSNLALVLKQIRLCRRVSNTEGLNRALRQLEKSIERFKSEADDQVCRQFPPITGFDTRILSRVYYCGADPLTKGEMRSLVRFEAKMDALQIPRCGNEEIIARHMANGTLESAITSNHGTELRRWQPKADASELLRAAADNFAELADLLSEAPGDLDDSAAEEEE